MIRKEKLFFATLALSIVVLSVLLFLNYSKSNQLKELTDKRILIEEEIRDVEEILFIDSSLESDIALASVELDNLIRSIKKQRSIWSDFTDKNTNLSLSQSSLSPSNVNANLVRLYTSLSTRCRDNGVVLSSNLTSQPPDSLSSETESMFGFALSSYIGFWPSFSKIEANQLDIQSKIIKQMIDALVTSTTQDQLIELKHIRRESVGSTDEKYIGKDLIRLPDANFLLRKKGFIDTLCFEICFVGRTEHARSFINQLSPPFSVRRISVNRIEDIEETSNIGNDSIGNDNIIPIIRDIKSSFVIQIEYVLNVHFDKNKLINSVKDTTSLSDSMKAIIEQITAAF